MKGKTMTNLVRHASAASPEPLPPMRLARGEERRSRRSLTRLEHRADLQTRAVELESAIGSAKVHAVANVGNAAMTAQALISGRERLLVEAEPAAIHGVAYVSQKLTLALGAVVDETVRRVTR